MSKEFKITESTIQPNHKEVEIWATPPDKLGNKEIKYYNQKSKKWQGSQSSNMEYYFVDRDSEHWGDMAFKLAQEFAAMHNFNNSTIGTISPTIGRATVSSLTDTIVCIAGSNEPLIYSGKVIDTGSWLKNMIIARKSISQSEASRAEKILIPITKEDFYRTDYDYKTVYIEEDP